jgi:hypothetical protein
LTRESPSGVSFIQQLATNIVNESLSLSNQVTQYEAKQIISRFDYFARNEDFVENKIKVYQQHHPEFNISSNLLRAILWTLSAETSSQTNDNSYLCASAIAWLKGEPINEAKIMKIPPQFSIINNNKKEAFDALCELLRIVSEYYSVVLAFDELEAMPPNDFGLPFWVNFSGLISNLHNYLPNIVRKNKVILITSWLETSWQTLVASLSRTGNTELSMTSVNKSHIFKLCSLPSLNEKPLKLIGVLSKDEGLNLVACWLKELKGNSSQNPYEPFKQSRIEAFLNSGPTPRKLWNWCAGEWLEVTETTNSTLQEIFNTYQSQADDSLFKNDNRIADLLELSFNFVKGKLIENVIVHQIQKMPKPKSAKFQLLLEGIENGKIIRIGIGVCQGHAATVGAMVKQLLDPDGRYSLTRGCFIRSKQLKLKPHIMAFQNIQQLVNIQGGKDIDLIDHQLFELDALFQSLNFFNKNGILLTPQDEEFKRKILTQSGLIKEILSSPKPK